MRTPFLAVAAVVAVILAGCEATQTGESAPTLLEPEAPSASITCTVYANATHTGAKYPISRLSIAQGCGTEPDKCGTFEVDTMGVTIYRDADGYLDKATIQCSPDSVATVYSNDSCWYCWGCSAPWSCGSQDACDLQPNWPGWDCYAYDCPSGYVPATWDEATEVPRCKKTWTAEECCSDGDCPSGEACVSGECQGLGVDLTGPSRILPDDFCTWTATLTGGASPFTYTWYYDGLWQKSGSDNTYTGGVLSGDTNNEFYLKVVVKDGNSATASDQMLIKEDPNAMACLH